MKTKIGLPFGLALVMFIGIFTTMLALGALSPSKGLEAVGGDFDGLPCQTLYPRPLQRLVLHRNNCREWLLGRGVPMQVLTPDDYAAITFQITFDNGFDVDEDGVSCCRANWMLGGDGP